MKSSDTQVTSPPPQPSPPQVTDPRLQVAGRLPGEGDLVCARAERVIQPGQRRQGGLLAAGLVAGGLQQLGQRVQAGQDVRRQGRGRAVHQQVRHDTVRLGDDGRARTGGHRLEREESASEKNKPENVAYNANI